MGLTVKTTPDVPLDEIDLGPMSKPMQYLTAREFFMKWAEAMGELGVEWDDWSQLSHNEQSAWHSLLQWVRQ